jgi:hypothetical protein
LNKRLGLGEPAREPLLARAGRNINADRVMTSPTITLATEASQNAQPCQFLGAAVMARPGLVTHDKPLPIHFEVRQPMFVPGMQIVSESRTHIVKPDSAAWDFDMALGGSARLDYTVEYSTR